jgi:uncharacterized protein (TIGR00255 family)
MIKSMTGYARVEKTNKGFMVIFEIRSYNSRHLDIVLRVPHGYHLLEDKIRSLIAKRVTRGHIEAKVQIKNDFDEGYDYEINMPKAKAYHDALRRLKNDFNLDPEISVDLLAREDGVIMPTERNRNIEADLPAIEDCINNAIDDLDAMRRKEGDFIAKDFHGRLNFIEQSIEKIEKESDNLLSYYQERLKERISVLTKGVAEIEPVRIAQEAAFLADKSDISEEILRAKSHIKQFRDTIDSDESAGRKLNFLLQEFNREFNTMGSKVQSANISHMIVEVKSELEKIREQLQNVE